MREVYLSKKKVEKSVKEAFQFFSLKLDGKKVFIKPNIAHNRPSPVTTSAEVVKATVLASYELGASEVFVGDSPSYPTKRVFRRPLKRIYRESGIGEAAQEAGAKLVFLDRSRWIKTTKKQWNPMIPLPLMKTDFFINLPVMKTHHMTTVSLGVKNLHGLIPDEQKILMHTDLLHQKLADLISVVPPDLTLIDATVAMEGNGPGQGEPVKLGAIIASTDTIACDVTACRIMGIPVSKVRHLSLAGGRNTRIDLHGPRIYRKFRLPDLRMEYEGVDVYEGDACIACVALLKTALHSIWKKNPELLLPMNIYLGKNPPFLGRKKLTFSIGDCAPRKGIFINGCPPFRVLSELRRELEIR